MLSGVLLIGVLLVGAAPPQDALGDYLAGQLVDGDHVVAPDGSFIDYGQTLDVGFALLTSGQHPEVLDKILTFAGKEESVAAYTRGVPFDKPDANYVGATAKLALLFSLAGKDPHAIGGLDLIAELQGLQGPTGRFADDSTFGDFANVFGQSFGVLALAAAGAPADEAATALIAARCADGTFPVSFETCATGTADATGLAIQALNAKSADALPDARRDALVAAVRGLEKARDGSGAWPGPGGLNANSTGYAAMGLLSVGQTVVASQAWLTSLQGADGGLPANPGQTSNLFASAQAAPALAGKSFLTTGEVLAPAITVPAVEPPVTTPTTTTTTTPAPTTTTTAIPAQASPRLAATGVSVRGTLVAVGTLLGGGISLLYLARRRRGSA
jgi:hypothetical protein